LGRRVSAVPASTPTVDGMAAPLSYADLTEYRYQGVHKRLRLMVDGHCQYSVTAAVTAAGP